MPPETTLKATPRSLLGANQGDLTLRVCRGEHAGRVLRLQSQKCTIGSGPQCTLRLRGRAFRPLHCLILRGASGTYVRRWAPDTCLNGRGFTVARLRTGDRLHVANVEFEVLNDGGPAEGEPLPTASAGTAHADAAADPAEQQRLEQEIARLESQVAELQRQYDVAVLEGEQAAQESEAARQSVQELQQQWQGAQTALTAGRDQWHAEQAQLQAQLNARTGELERVRDELETSRQHLQQELHSTQSQLQQLTEASQQLQASQTQLQQTNEQLSRELQEARDNAQPDQQPLIQELRDALAQLQAQFHTQAEEKDQLQSQLEATSKDRSELEQALAAAHGQLDESAQLAERIEQVTSELESAREDLESRTQKWEDQLAERKAAIQELREQLEQAGRHQQQQMAERESISSRMSQLEAENQRLVDEIANLQPSPPADSLTNEAVESDDAEWQEKVASLQAELERTRSEHQQAVAEWQADRSSLEKQLAEGRDKLVEFQRDHDASMQEAEQLIHSLQQEGKDLLSQLQEAKYAIRHDTEMRRQIEAEVADQQGGEPGDLRQTVQMLQAKCRSQEEEIDRQTILLQSVIDHSPAATGQATAETNEQDAANSAGEAETQDQPSRATEDQAATGNTLVLSGDFSPELPEEIAEIVDRFNEGLTEDGTLRLPSTEDQVDLVATDPRKADDAADDERIIQSYMDRLLQRVGCQPQQREQVEEPVATPPSDDEAAVDDTPLTSEVAAAAQPSRPNSEANPGSREMAEDLLAMRELANRSARMAISSSDQRRVFMSAVGEFGVAAVSLAISSAVVAMSPEWMSVYSIGGYFGLAFGCVWGIYGVRSLLDARALGKSAD